ncbi:MAG TPA: hypothetical protein VFP44_09605 [Usitatibacter sp.]|nr:hypothetical protein [Usitatibacter sp.]
MVVAAVAALALAWNADRIEEKVLYWRFGASLPPAAYPAPRDATQARLQDLDYLSQLTRVDRSFTPQAATEFARRVAGLREKAASLDRAGFLLGVSEAVAAADNAHTNVDTRAWREQLASSPVRFEWFAEGLHVVRARPEAIGLLGARVLAIDGLDPETLAREASRYFGGPPEFARTSSLVYLESPEAIHAVHAEAPADHLSLRVADGQGRERSVDVAALPPPQPPAVSRAGRLLSPVPLPDEDPAAWRPVLDPRGSLPPSLRDPERSLFAARLDEDTLYLHLWQVRDDAGGPVGEAMSRALGGRAWRRIVLDVRFDRGGDYPTVYAALRHMPRSLAPGGRILVLIDNTSFSAAIIVAALEKHFGGSRTTLVGQRAGDRLAFWAEGNSFTLPNSKLKVMTSTGYHDWAHGCRELRCFWPNLWYDVAVGSVDPAVPAAWRFADYRRGVDTVLERALER